MKNNKFKFFLFVSFSKIIVQLSQLFEDFACLINISNLKKTI